VRRVQRLRQRKTLVARPAGSPSDANVAQPPPAARAAHRHSLGRLHARHNRGGGAGAGEPGTRPRYRHNENRTRAAVTAKISAPRAVRGVSAS
jgi:hypothetical protein